MEKKKITFSNLKKVMGPKELKNVLGGSAKTCACGGEETWARCQTDSDCPAQYGKCYCGSWS